MSSRNRRNNDADNVAGCLFIIFIALGIWLWNVVRPKAQPYSPDGLDAEKLPSKASTQIQANAKETFAGLSTVVCIGTALFLIAGRAATSEILLVVLPLGLITISTWSWALRDKSNTEDTQPVNAIQSHQELPPLSPSIIYTIQVPQDREADHEVDLKLITELVGRYPGLAYEIDGNGRRIRFRIHDTQALYRPETVAASIRSHFDQQTCVSWQQVDTPNVIEQPFYRVHAYFKLGLEYAHPLPTFIKPNAYDYLIPLTRRLDFLKTDYGERITYRLIVRSLSTNAGKQAHKRIKDNQVEGLKSFGDLERGHQDFVFNKLNSFLYHCLLVVTIETEEHSRLPELTEVVNSVISPDCEWCNILIPEWSPVYTVQNPDDYLASSVKRLLDDWVNNRDESWRTRLMLLAPHELVLLWHPPNKIFTARQIDWNGETGIPLPEPLKHVESGIPIGVNRICGEENTVYLSQENREMPMTILGKPGTGKTSLMHTMIHADIWAGRGVCVIDPKGSLISRILQHSIPPERDADVVVLDVKTRVGGIWYPPPLNIMSSDVRVSEDIAAEKLVNVVERLFEHDDFKNREMADTLSMAVMALSNIPHPTVQDIYRMFYDPPFRQKIMKKLTDIEQVNFWRIYDGQSTKQQEERAHPIIRRLRVLYRNHALKSITCHPDRLNLTELVASKKIILVSLGASENEMPNIARNVLGTYLMIQLDMIARERVIEGEPFMLYVDETQEFITSPLPSMLSQLREYRLGLVLANQLSHQLVGDTLKTLQGTASALVGFEVGKEDANLLGSYMQPELTASDFMNLGKYKAGLSLVYRDQRQRPFTVEMAAPPGYGKEDVIREAMLRRKSIEQLKLKPFDEVNRIIQNRYNGGDDENGSKDEPDDDNYFE